jgi:hypothetical protein
MVDIDNLFSNIQCGAVACYEIGHLRSKSVATFQKEDDFAVIQLNFVWRISCRMRSDLSPTVKLGKH